MNKHFFAKVKSNPAAARTAYFNKTRLGTRNMNLHQLATAMQRAGLTWYSF